MHVARTEAQRLVAAGENVKAVGVGQQVATSLLPLVDGTRLQAPVVASPILAIRVGLSHQLLVEAMRHRLVVVWVMALVDARPIGSLGNRFRLQHKVQATESTGPVPSGGRRVSKGRVGRN